MSEAVERKLVAAARQPHGLALRQPDPRAWTSWSARRTAGRRRGRGRGRPVPPAFEVGLQRLDELARRGGGPVEVRRIAEHVQVDAELMVELKAAGVVPGHDVRGRCDRAVRRRRAGERRPTADRRRVAPTSRTRCWCAPADGTSPVGLGVGVRPRARRAGPTRHGPTGGDPPRRTCREAARHRRRRLRRQRVRRAPGGRRATRWPCSTTCRPATATRCPTAPQFVEADLGEAADERARRRLRRRAALRGALAGRRVGERPELYWRTS